MKSQVILVLVGVALLGGLFYILSASPNASSENSVVARNGMHWHPALTIYIDDVKQELPANIGLVGGHYPMHTHSEDAGQGVLHLEFDGVVRMRDLRLNNFFSVWGGKQIESAFGTLEKMVVNGTEVTEYGTYAVGEHDVIELYYTTHGDMEETSNGTSMQVPAPGVDPNSVGEMIVNTQGAVSEE